MKFYHYLTTEQKVYLARKLENIFNKSIATDLLGMNRNTYDKYKYKELNLNDFEKFKSNRKEVISNGF